MRCRRPANGMRDEKIKEKIKMNVPFLDLKRQYQGLREEIVAAIRPVMEEQTFIGGKHVHDFEGQIARYLNVKYALGCGNGTEALVLALRACDVKPGDEVITTPFTFFATAEAIASIGAVPVFVDICEEDYNIDPEQIEKKITERTRAILPVHIFGAPCRMREIMEIAHRHGLKVIEDDAQAIGSRYEGRMAGTLGDIGCFSFYPTKNLGGFGDGGLVTTNDEGLAVILAALREHGAGKNGARALELLGGDAQTEALTEGGSSNGLYDPYKYYNYLIGYNSRLDAIQAAVLAVKLMYLDEFNAARARVAGAYQAGLCDAVRKPSYRADITPCWHQYVVMTPYKYELCAYLQEHQVGCGTFYPVPLHLQKAFSQLGYQPGSLPVAEKVSAQSVCLPVFPELTQEEIEYVIKTTNDFFADRK